jgi:TolB-like protein/class 3 adenylate cyclase
MSSEQKVTRKLRAILSADVKGYSLLMADDEAHTIQTLKAYRSLMTDLIQNYSGRVVDNPGDNLLAEFSSAFDAVEAAVKIQNRLQKENAKFVEDKRLEFRIGVNIGDVVHDGDRIYGNGVNVAARIEGLSDPGGVCISRNTYDHVKNKLNLGYEYIGKHSVKNIKDPIRVYKIIVEDKDAGKLIGDVSKSVTKKWIRATVLVAAVVITVTVFLVYQKMAEPEFEPAKVEEMAYSLPEKPSIAVLPFENMSGDPEQEYFSDGMTEDIITDLSKISGIFVIGRNSTFTYKGKPTKIRQVAEELGVRYILEGSVRKAENTVRINAQLIDAIVGDHVWAERYDEQLDNIFKVQDNITQQIVEMLAVKLTIDEMQTIPKRETDSLEAYLTFLKGWQHYRRFTATDFSKAIPHLEKAIMMDQNFSRGYASLARIYFELSVRDTWRRELGINKNMLFKHLYNNLRNAMKTPNSLAYAVSAELKSTKTLWEEGISDAEKAVSLDPNDPESHRAKGVALMFSGMHSEAVESFKIAMRLDPIKEASRGYLLGMAYFHLSQFDKTVSLCEKSVKISPENKIPLWYLTAAQGHLGNNQEAASALAKLMEFNPYATLVDVKFGFKFKNFDDIQLLEDGLRKAGMQ